MNPLPRLLSLLWPGCGQSGTDGVAIPPLLDMTRIERPAKPNNALAGPSGDGRQAVDVVTEPYRMPPAELFAAAGRALAFMPNCWLLGRYGESLQAHYVMRSRICNFPDLISIQVEPWDTGSVLIVWSRSLHGHYDFNANLRRINEYMAEIAIEAATVTRGH